MDNTNLFTSSSDGSFQVNTNFANERLTNMGVNRAQEGFDREMEARETAAVNTALQEAKPALPAPHNKDPKTMTQEERHAALQIIDQRMQSAGIENRLRGDSDRNPILGEITDGFRNIGQAFGVGNRVSGESGMVDADGNFHPRTCFTKGTLVTKLKARYYEEARNGGLAPDARYEEKVAIETIKAGDFVLSFDENAKVKSYKKVTDTFVRITERIYKVVLVSGEKLETTWNHPFWVLKKGVVRESGQVELGASLVGAITSPNLSDIDSSSTTSPLRSGKGTTSPNSFGVGLSSERSPLLKGEGTGSFNGEWISAKDLKAGDVSLTAGGKRLLIASITPSSQSETVYNFSVADNHTYFVGVDGVLVHNDAYLIYVPEAAQRLNQNLGHTMTAVTTKDGKVFLIEYGPYGRGEDAIEGYEQSKHGYVLRIDDVKKLGIKDLKFDSSGSLTKESEKKLIQGIMDNKYDTNNFTAKVVHLPDVSGEKALDYAKKEAANLEAHTFDSYNALYHNCTTVACNVLKSGGMKEGDNFYIKPESLYKDVGKGNRVLSYVNGNITEQTRQNEKSDQGACGENMSCPKKVDPLCGVTKSCNGN